MRCENEPQNVSNAIKRPVYSVPAMRSMADSTAWDEAYGRADLRWTIAAHRDVERHLGPLQPGRALELGCGEGRQAIWLAQRGWNVTAVDFSSVAVERGRRLAERHGVTVDWVVADVTGYEPTPDLDLVFVVYLHVEPDALAGLLARAGAALAVGGTLLVLGWHRDSAGGPQPRRLRYSVEELTRAVPGLEIVHAGRVTQAGDPGATDAVMVARRAPA